MTILGKENLEAEAARRAKFRLNHVGTKLNEAELRAFEALVKKRQQTQAEFIRGGWDLGILWSTGWELNPRILVLQTSALATSPPVLMLEGLGFRRQIAL